MPVGYLDGPISGRIQAISESVLAIVVPTGRQWRPLLILGFSPQADQVSGVREVRC